MDVVEKAESNIQLSVIIPCLNGEATIAEQLEALASQKWSEPWELIISDNGSTDRSKEIAKNYQKHFSRFQIVDASHRRGGPYALNMGAKAASSDKLACCDADDEVASGWVAAMGEILSQKDIVCGKFLFDKFNEPHIAKRSAEAWKDGLYTGRFLPGGGSGNFGVKRWLHEAVGGFDESLPHGYDADYFWRIQLEGYTLHYEPEAVVQVRIGRVKPSLSYLFRRSINQSSSNCWSYKRFRALGMRPPPTLMNSFNEWVSTFKKFAKACLYNRQEKQVWLEKIVQQTGHFVGNVQGRLTNPLEPYQPGRKK